MGVLDVLNTRSLPDLSEMPPTESVLYVFRSENKTLAPIFTDANLTFSTSNPIRSSDTGDFPEVFLAGGVYRIEIYDRLEKNLLYFKDNVIINDDDVIGVHHGFYNMDSLLRSSRLSYLISEEFNKPAQVGDIVFVADGSFTFQVIPEDSADYDMITIAGVKLNALGNTLSPEQFGVEAGTGKTSAVAQRNVTQLNKMLKRAAALGSKVYFPAGITIEIANAISPVKIPSGISVEGNRCFIQAQDDEGPIITSAAWADNTAIGGQGSVDGLIARGTLTEHEISGGVGAPTSQDGFIIFDYHSRWTNCEAWRCKGRGIVVEESNSAGNPAYGTLVENRFSDCIARKCVGRGFDLAPDQLGKLTDGWLIDPIVEQPNGSTAEAIALSVSAGWRIQGAHTYGGRPDVAVLVSRAFNTEVGAMYIETFDRVGISFTQVQESLGVGNIKLRANVVSASGAAAVQIERSSGVTEAYASIASVQIEKGTGTVPLEIIKNLTGNDTMTVNMGSYQIKGANASYVTPVPDSANWLWVANRTRVLGQLKDNSAEKRLAYQGVQLLGGLQQQWSGSGPKSVTLSIPYVSNYHQNRKMVCDLTIFSFQNHNAARRSLYRGVLLISGRDSGGPWKVDLVDTMTPFGFTTPPTVGAITVTGNQSGTNALGLDVQFNFTPEDGDGYGTAALTMGATLGV